MQKSRSTKWETDEEFHEFRIFLRATGQTIEKIRNQRKGKSAKRAAKNSGVPGRYTLEWMDTDPDRIDVKYFQGLVNGKKNFTMLTLFKICRKLSMQPERPFKQAQITFLE